MNYNKIFIDGEYIDSLNKDKWIEVENPATKEIFEKVPNANEQDVDKAVEAANRAFKTFSRTTLEERISYIEKFANYLEKHKNEIAKTVQKELGVTLKWSLSSHVEKNIDRSRVYAKIAKEYQFSRKEKGCIVVKEPVGVVALLAPWNYPIGQIIQKLVPAILAGNTVICKPSKQTPLSAYYLVEAFKEAGLPKGVFNLITGEGVAVGDYLSGHPGIDKVSFTGSTSAGAKVGSKAISEVKRVTLELGGKSACLFIDNTNMDNGITHVLNTVFLNAGQTCSALTRVVILEKDKEEFYSKLKEQFKNYKMGDPTDESVNVGPVSSKRQYDTVVKYIEIGKKEATILAGSGYYSDEKGYYVEPIVFTDVDKNSPLAIDEIFGPVVSVIIAKNIDEMIEISNNSEYGLSGAIYGDKEKAMEIVPLLRTGGVYVNTSKASMYGPFGGFKKSGIGREAGKEGFEAFLETKTIFIED